MMLEMISAGQKRVDQILAGIDQDISKNSPTIRAVTAQHLPAREGYIRARAALQLLCSAIGPHDPEAAVALATSCELTYISNKIHNEVYYLDEFALRAGAAHLRILAGDYLFSLSSAFVAKSGNIAAMQAAINSLARVSEASLNLTYDDLYHKLAGGYGYQSYQQHIQGRIGSIFVAAVETGSILANLPADISGSLAQYSQQISMVSQLAKTQIQLQQREPSWQNLPVESAEVALVMYNELRTHLAGLPILPPASSHADPARAMSDAVQQILPYRPQIIDLIELQKQSHVESARAQIPSLTGSNCREGLVELVDIAARGRFN